jgi:hypothetical protein
LGGWIKYIERGDVEKNKINQLFFEYKPNLRGYD